MYSKQKEMKEFIKKMESGHLQSLLEQDGDFASQYQHIKDKLKQAEKRELAMQYTEEIMMKMFEKSQKSGKCAICTRKLDETEIQKIQAKCQEIISKSSSFTGTEQKNLEDLKQQKAL